MLEREALVCVDGRQRATPCSQDGADTPHGFKAVGGRRFGNKLGGARAGLLLAAQNLYSEDLARQAQCLSCPCP